MRISGVWCKYIFRSICVRSVVFPAHSTGLSTSLWVWERALAPRGSSFKNAQLKRHRATTNYPTQKRKEKTWNTSCAAQTGNKYLPDHHWTISNYHCMIMISQLLPIFPPGQSFLFIFLSLAVWLCLKKCSDNRVLVVLLQIGASDLTVIQIIRWSKSLCMITEAQDVLRKFRIL